jgi:hypothetical protein
MSKAKSNDIGVFYSVIFCPNRILMRDCNCFEGMGANMFLFL